MAVQQAGAECNKFCQPVQRYAAAWRNAITLQQVYQAGMGTKRYRTLCGVISAAGASDTAGRGLFAEC